MVDDKMVQSSSLIINDVHAAAKQARNEVSLMQIMKKYFLVKSMAPNGDCGYELMCMWERILHLRRQGNPITKRVIEEDVDPQEEAPARSMFDWFHSPMENNQRNEEVAAALQSLPAGVQEMDWLSSKDVLDLYLSLIRSGLHEVLNLNHQKWRLSA